MARKRDQGDVTLNVASMLDMAFQLLSFFVLTFHPMNEREIVMTLPPPQMLAGTGGTQKAGSDTSSTELPKGVNTLVITVFPNAEGDIGSFAMAGVGDTVVENKAIPVDPSLGALKGELQRVLGDPASLFDQVIIQAGSSLRYDALMKVIDLCSRQKMPDGKPLSKLSFAEAPSGQGT